MFEILEFEICDGASCKIKRQTRFVRLVDKVPHVDTVSLCDEDDTWASGGESSACVVRPEGVRRFEDRLVELLHRGLPDAEVEIVHRQNQIPEERRSL